MKVVLEGGDKSIISLINELNLKLRRNKIKYSYVTEQKAGRPKKEDPVIEEKKEEIKTVENEKPGRKKTTQKAKAKSKK